MMLSIINQGTTDEVQKKKNTQLSGDVVASITVNYLKEKKKSFLKMMYCKIITLSS